LAARSRSNSPVPRDSSISRPHRYDRA
jgi:hypothetical protein